jgi:dienelactone hydrolase
MLGIVPHPGFLPAVSLAALLALAAGALGEGGPLPGTALLTVEGDLSAQMVAGIGHWLDRETARVAAERARKWLARDPASPKADNPFWHLSKILGFPRGASKQTRFEELHELEESERSAEAWTATRVRWPVLDGVWGEGLLLRPRQEIRAVVIAIPDADQTPEQIAGLEEGVAPESQFARRLADQGCLVLVPLLVNRNDAFSGNSELGRLTNQPHREWLHRQAFEVGLTLYGFELKKIGTAVWRLPRLGRGKVGIFGYGEGGLLALHAGGTGWVNVTLVSGYFGSRDQLWMEPIYRNFFGYLRETDDAVLAGSIEDRDFIVEHSTAPAINGPPTPHDGRNGAAPGAIRTPSLAEVQTELRRTNEMRARLGDTRPARLICREDGTPLAPGSEPALRAFLEALGLGDSPLATPRPPRTLTGTNPMEDARQRRAVKEIETFTQKVLATSDAVRAQTDLWKKLAPDPAWTAVQAEARDKFWKDTIGKLPTDYLPPKPRTRQILEHEKWTAYDVMLDVHPDVFAWGVLLLPKDLQPGEHRPVVVCQHGLEGLPMDTITDDQSLPAWKTYQAFAARLAERGFIVYAPHNPYCGGDRFRELQRKANPLGLSLFSFIIAQHDVTTRWLASLPFVDPDRIAFYGLSYGGKTAMRVPAVLDRYCLSICSGDFNEWVRKTASVDYPSSYLFTGEYEIFEWDLAHTFNYAEMALLIAPRPFMVERGHHDGVASDEWVAYEFAKVRRAYTKLGIPDRAAIEWFDGPHTIHGVGTFKFLHQHLRWPEPK